MKKIIGVLATYASAAVLAASFINVSELKAQTATPSPAAAAAQGNCSPEAKLAVYTEFLKIRADQDKAYELAKKYIACPTNPGEETYANYLRDKFVAPIDKARRPVKVNGLVYVAKDYTKAFELGKQVLADEPDNLRVLIDLAYAGYLAFTQKVNTFNPDTLTYGKKAIQLLQAGGTLDNWTPYSGKDEALGYLNNTVGVLTIDKDPSEALRHMIKAAQLEGKLKTQAITYGYIGDAYQSGPYEKLSADYNARFKDKDETPESKLALENLNQVIDRMIDAYARAVSLAGSDAALQSRKKGWLETLTGYYSFRHKGSDAGLTDMIASVMSKPLPPEPTPITTLPAATPATTTTPVSGTATGSGNGAAAPATTGKPVTTPASSAVPTAPKPTATPNTTAVKPKPKLNHAKPKSRRGR